MSERESGLGINEFGQKPGGEKEEGQIFPEEGIPKGSMLRVSGVWYRILGYNTGSDERGWLIEDGKGQQSRLAFEDPNIEARTDNYGFQVENEQR